MNFFGPITHCLALFPVLGIGMGGPGREPAVPLELVGVWQTTALVLSSPGFPSRDDWALARLLGDLRLSVGGDGRVELQVVRPDGSVAEQGTGSVRVLSGDVLEFTWDGRVGAPRQRLVYMFRNGGLETVDPLRHYAFDLDGDGTDESVTVTVRMHRLT